MARPFVSLQTGFTGGPEQLIVLLVLVALLVVTVLFLAVGLGFVGGAYLLSRRSQQADGDEETEGQP